MSDERASGGTPRGEARWVDADEPAPAPSAAPPAEPSLVGESTVLRGGARLDAQLEPTPVTSPDPAPSTGGRRLDEAEIAAAGLFQERVVEVRETREEAVVAKPVFVREEVVVRKTAETHVARIDDTVRHTEIEVDDLAETPTGQDPGAPETAQRRD